MTALTRRVDPSTAPWVALLGVLCVGLGVAAGYDAKYAVAGLLGLAFVAAVFLDLTVGLALFTVLASLDLFSGGTAVSLLKVAGLVLFVAWMARRATGAGGATGAVFERHPAMAWFIVAFLAWNLISVLWAQSRGEAFTTVYRYALVMLLIPIVFTGVRERRHVTLLVAAFLLGAVVSAVYGILHPVAQLSSTAGVYEPLAYRTANTRLQGGLGDPNIEASVLVPAIVLALGLGVLVRRSPWKLALVGVGVVLAFIGLVGTQSRTGLVALAAVLVMGVLLGGRWRGAAAKLLVVGAAAVIGYFAFLASSSAVSRITSSGTSGRSDLWRVAWRMFEAHPILGVGAGNYPVESVHYIHQPGLITAAVYIVQAPKEAHNIYLQALAELGLPGLVLMFGILIAGVAAGLRAARTFERLGDWQMEVMARCTMLALVAFMAANFFIPNLISKQMWLVFALCPALLAIAERRAAQLGLADT